MRVNAIAPGLIQTKLSEYYWKDETRRRAQIERQPIRHLGQPQEIAEAAVMLAGDGASYLTGQTLVIDGGYCFCPSERNGMKFSDVFLTAALAYALSAAGADALGWDMGRGAFTPWRPIRCVRATRFNNQTVREVVHVSLGGDTVRVRLSNAFSAVPVDIGAVHIALRKSGADILATSDHTLTFSGRPAVTFPPARSR